MDEALRLFQVSTLDAALSGALSGTCNMYSLYMCICIVNEHMIHVHVPIKPLEIMKSCLTCGIYGTHVGY